MCAMYNIYIHYTHKCNTVFIPGFGRNQNEFSLSMGLWQWCVTLGITGFWILFIMCYSKEHRRTLCFRSWICFHPQVRGLKTPTLLGPLERANFIHWIRWSWVLEQSFTVFITHIFFFNLHSGGVESRSTRHCGHLMAYCVSPGWLW
jgi:hypothetical protein